MPGADAGLLTSRPSCPRLRSISSPLAAGAHRQGGPGFPCRLFHPHNLSFSHPVMTPGALAQVLALYLVAAHTVQGSAGNVNAAERGRVCSHALTELSLQVCGARAGRRAVPSSPQHQPPLPAPPQPRRLAGGAAAASALHGHQGADGASNAGNRGRQHLRGAWAGICSQLSNTVTCLLLLTASLHQFAAGLQPCYNKLLQRRRRETRVRIHSPRWAGP